MRCAATRRLFLHLILLLLRLMIIIEAGSYLRLIDSCITQLKAVEGAEWEKGAGEGGSALSLSASLSLSVYLSLSLPRSPSLALCLSLSLALPLSISLAIYTYRAVAEQKGGYRDGFVFQAHRLLYHST